MSMTDMTVLNPYTDKDTLSSWAKDATALCHPDRHLHARREQDPAQASW